MVSEPNKVVGPIGPPAIRPPLHISSTLELRSLGMKGCVGDLTMTRDKAFQ